jgi:hypothetical protein
MLSDLITSRPAPPNRASYCDEGREDHLSEGAVMIAFSMHLLRTVTDVKHVAIHPDGEHAKRFDFKGWLERNGFTLDKPTGKTTFAGVYNSTGGHQLVVNPKPGQGDVLADIQGQSFVAECKGGVLNTRHPGQQSRLRQGLCEAVGLSLATPKVEGRRQFAVVPQTETTEALAKRMAARARDAGIEIALVDGLGNVHFVEAMAGPDLEKVTSLA